jgi:hypothetical protein
MSKLIETMGAVIAGRLQPEAKYVTARDIEQGEEIARAILAAMCEGPAFEEMVDRAEAAMTSGKNPPVWRNLADAAIRAALTEEDTNG